VLVGLSAVAFTWPLLDLYGKNPDVFVANRSSAAQIFLFAFGVALFVPLLCWAVLAVANVIGGRAPTVAYYTMVVLLALATGLVVSRQATPDSTFLAIVLTLAVAWLVVWIVRTLDTVFVVAAVALPVLLFMFLGTSATASIIWSEPEEVEIPANVGSPSNVVFLQLDEFPIASIMDTDGTINDKLFPNFARLADEGTWYRNALSTSIATTQSVPAIASGLRGEAGVSPSYADHPNNLFTLLGGSYEMHVIEWVAQLCPEETCPDYAGRSPARFTSLLKDLGVVYGHLTMPPAVRYELPAIDTSWRGFLGQASTPSGTGVEVDGLPVPPDPVRSQWIDWVQRLINGIDAGSPPTLSYAHLQAPHVPWVLNPSGTQYVRPEEYTEVEGLEGDGHWELDPSAALLGFQRLLYQVGFLDTMIGRLLDHIQETGTWDDTMIVVIADHGESFVPGEHRRWPYDNNRDDLYRIPLFIKYPGQTTGKTVDIAAFGTDVLPTIVDALDIDTDWAFDGMSLRDVTVDRPHDPLKWCCNGSGVSTDVNILFDQVKRNHEWVPDQSSWLGIAGVGPYAGLVGSSTDDLDITATDAFRWSLDLGADLSDVDLSKGMVQTLIKGRLESDDSPDSTDLIVALNDVVAGVAHLTKDSATGGTVEGLLAEELVQDGHNDVELLLPDGNGGWMTGESDVISHDLVAGDGHVLDIKPEGNKRLQVDTVEPSDDGWQLSGWAADVTAKVVPDTFYVFVGDSLLYEGPPNVEDPNVVRWFGSDDLLESGFQIDISSGDVPQGVDQLTVVAEFGDVAISDVAVLNG
jgi:hypothetical protein